MSERESKGKRSFTFNKGNEAAPRRESPRRESNLQRESPRRETNPRTPKKYEPRPVNVVKKTVAVKQVTRNENEMRLNRFIANAGICSRREADKLISEGQITVNGKVVTELGTIVNKTDDIRYNEKRLSIEPLVYILMNKPKDVVTSVKDPHANRTVMDLVKNACDERIYPVGRLDRNTTGVLLLTNDGELAKKLTHPKHQVKKIYHVHLNKPVEKNHLVQIAEGFELEDGFIKADVVSYVDNDKHQIGIEIHSGRNRIVRRIFETLGYEVEKLDRVYFSGLTKKNLQRGHWRFLTAKEITYLKAGILK
jgi:23S rRNA pseudouridine2605 synthase